MKIVFRCAFTMLLAGAGFRTAAQMPSLARLPAAERLPVFWRYCVTERISDKDSLVVHRFLSGVVGVADSLHDQRLKTYAEFALRCWHIIFSQDFPRNYPLDDYLVAVDKLSETRSWALEKGYPDIAAACAHFIGQIYYLASRFGLAFEYLLKADEEFEKIGYVHIINASQYLYALALDFYQFEDYDKALNKFLQVSNYNFFNHRDEVNTFNAIGLIYARRAMPDKALFFFRKTVDKAALYHDSTWIGIAWGNMGNVFLGRRQYDSAFVYHSKNYWINAIRGKSAPEDAAKSALSIAQIYLHKHYPDSALRYIGWAGQLATRSRSDSLDKLEVRRRLLKTTIEYLKSREDYHKALLLTDSLSLTEQQIRNMLDNKILSRAIEKTDAMSYDTRLSLLKGQKNLEKLQLILVITLLVVVLLAVFIVLRARWLREKRQKQLAEKDRQILVAEKLRAEDGWKHSKELLNAYIDTIKEKTTLIEQLETELTDLRRSATHSPELEIITSSTREKLLTSTILTDQEWHQFRVWFEQVYPGFSYRLKETYPRLSPAESRFLYLMKLDLSSREMAAMLGISVEAIHKLRYRLRKKLQLDEDVGFETVISKIS